MTTKHALMSDDEIDAMLALTQTEGYPSDVRALVHAVQRAERERCATLLRKYRVSVGNSAAGEIAAEMTMDALRELYAAIRDGEQP
jgi:hypothetical protein